MIGRFGEFSGIREKAQRAAEGESGRQRPRSRRFTASDGMQAPDTAKIIPKRSGKTLTLMSTENFSTINGQKPQYMVLLLKDKRYM